MTPITKHLPPRRQSPLAPVQLSLKHQQWNVHPTLPESHFGPSPPWRLRETLHHQRPNPTNVQPCRLRGTTTRRSPKRSQHPRRDPGQTRLRNRDALQRPKNEPTTPEETDSDLEDEEFMESYRLTTMFPGDSSDDIHQRAKAERTALRKTWEQEHAANPPPGTNVRQWTIDLPSKPPKAVQQELAKQIRMADEQK